MTIPANKIPGYLRGVSFPLPLKGEKGDAIIREVSDLVQLRTLVAAEAIVAIGGWNRIRYLRLNRVTRTPIALHWEKNCATLRQVWGLPMRSGDQTSPAVPIVRRRR